jgi:hypothetical protein
MAVAETLPWSAYDAIIFALNYSSQQVERPLMNRLSDGPRASSGLGMVGTDGAAQAGFILQELRACGPLHEAILTAQYAPKSWPCSCHKACCSGHTPNRVREQAIRALIELATRELAGSLSHYRVRQRIIESFFGGPKVIFSTLADETGVHRETIAAHHAKLELWILGDLKRKRGGVVGEKHKAWEAFSSRLVACGMVERA